METEYGRVEGPYHRLGYTTRHGHHVRNSMEELVCNWLLEHAVAHRHASRMIMVYAGPRRTPTVFVPDIILHDKDFLGRSVLLEVHQVNSPKAGGTRILAEVRKQESTGIFIVVVTRRKAMGGIVKGAYDALVPIENLDELYTYIPPPPE